MPHPEPRSLLEALGVAGQPGSRFLAGAEAAACLCDLGAASSLEAAPGALHGRSVLLATRDQFAAALAMIELDGSARRLVLLPPGLPPAHVAAIAQTAAADALVSDGDAPAASVAGVSAARATGRPDRPAAPRGEPLRTEWVLLTSGTTGVPKLVVHDFRSLAGPAVAGADLGRGAVWATFYDIRRYGGLAMFFRAIVGGGSMVLSSAEEPTADFLNRLASRAVTHVSGTPSHWRRALMSPAVRQFAPRYVRMSGEIADQTILDQLRAHFPGAGVAHAFASTEAGLAFEVNDGRAGFPASLVERSDGDVALRVVEGTLRIRSPRTASRYLDPGRVLRDGEGFVDTGDLVERRGDRYVFVGRRDGVINVGGAKVHPEEIEAVINAQPGVRMSLARARPSPITGAVVAADVVAAPGQAGAELERAILDACRRELPRHKVPAMLRFVDALGVASSGKLGRGDA